MRIESLTQKKSAKAFSLFFFLFFFVCLMYKENEKWENSKSILNLSIIFSTLNNKKPRGWKTGKCGKGVEIAIKKVYSKES